MGREPWEEAPAPEVPTVTFVTTGTYPVYWAKQPRDEQYAGAEIIAAFVGPHMLARRIMADEDWAVLRPAAATLFDGGVPLACVVMEQAPGITMDVFALVLASRVPRESWAESPDEDDRVAMPLGRLMRYVQDRKHPRELVLEGLDVLGATLEGRAEPLVDRALRHLGG